MTHHQSRGAAHGVSPPSQAVELKEQLLSPAHLAAQCVVGAELAHHFPAHAVEKHAKRREDFPLLGWLFALDHAADQRTHGGEHALALVTHFTGGDRKVRHRRDHGAAQLRHGLPGAQVRGNTSADMVYSHAGRAVDLREACLEQPVAVLLEFAQAFRIVLQVQLQLIKRGVPVAFRIGAEPAHHASAIA